MDEIKNALDLSGWTHGFGSKGWDVRAVDETTKADILKIFDLLDEVAPVGDDNKKELWLQIRRPTLDEYLDYNHYVDRCFPEDDRTPDDELCEEYKTKYPNETVWVPLVTVNHHIDKDFYAIFLSHMYVLSIGDCNEKGWPVDATPLTRWILKATGEAIKKLQAGTYNEEVAQELPTAYRHGMIGRKDYWDIYPDFRKSFMKDLTKEEIAEFLEAATEEDPTEDTLLPRMTARTYYDAFALCHDAVGYDRNRFTTFKETEEEKDWYGGTSAREKYFHTADGRDDNLRSVPLDDPEAFNLWYNHKGCYEFNGSHPWEVRTSGSISFSIHLFPIRQDNGWFFRLDGDSYGSSTEIVKYYLALKHAGIPVSLRNTEKIKARYTETDYIGIVPRDAFSPFMDGGYYFGNAHISECTFLGLEDHDDFVAEKAVWMPEKPVTLKDNIN